AIRVSRRASAEPSPALRRDRMIHGKAAAMRPSCVCRIRPPAPPCPVAGAARHGAPRHVTACPFPAAGVTCPRRNLLQRCSIHLHQAPGETVMSRVLISLSAAVLLGMAGAASADVLLVDRMQQETQMAMPSRGMSMAQVEARFGAPSQKLDARGGQKRQWPTINRWVYPGFVVYFEKSRVIDA